jgi:hypothetical protein
MGAYLALFSWKRRKGNRAKKKPFVVVFVTTFY